MASHACPKCGSGRVKDGYPDIECLACGYRQPLVDFPISWDWHRYYCQEGGAPDPGPDQPPRHALNEDIEQRLEGLEQRLDALNEAELRQLRLNRIYDELQGLKRGLRYTQRAMAQSIRHRRKQPAGLKLTEL